MDGGSRDGGWKGGDAGRTAHSGWRIKGWRVESGGVEVEGGGFVWDGRWKVESGRGGGGGWRGWTVEAGENK